jgi:hypothetical protein
MGRLHMFNHMNRPSPDPNTPVGVRRRGSVLPKKET